MDDTKAGRSLRDRPRQSQLAQIELLDKDVNHPNRIVIADQSSRHSGNSVLCPRSMPAIKRFIRPLRKSRRNHTARIK